MFAKGEKRSDVVWIMSDIIFSMSYVVFPASFVVFGEFREKQSIEVLR